MPNSIQLKDGHPNYPVYPLTNSSLASHHIKRRENKKCQGLIKVMDLGEYSYSLQEAENPTGDIFIWLLLIFPLFPHSISVAVIILFP